MTRLSRLRTISFVTAVAAVVLCAAPLSSNLAEAGALSDVRMLLGPVEFKDDCTPSMRRMLQDTAEMGRAVARSEAFAQCLDEAFRKGINNSSFYGSRIGPYLQCKGDSFYGAAIDTQIAHALTASRSVNPVAMNCTGTTVGNASANVGKWGHGGPDEFKWSGWLAGAASTTEEPVVSAPVCGSAEAKGVKICRWAPYPWPYSQAAGIVWHEAMHTQGYVHGDNTKNDLAQKACGYEGKTDAEWHFQLNTVPYIVQACVELVIVKSTQVCTHGGALRACPSATDLKLIAALHSTQECACVPATPHRLGWPAPSWRPSAACPDDPEGWHPFDLDAR